eukprot:GFUD01042613.1.p1 GENE.GFUD01042613.1~~GFUD01042613.1.p1  ORF type:complete len:351 (-),score=141.82 GFUD01042613.1:63-1043(-)
MEDDSCDMPEDLSAKHRTVSVQTETCIHDKFEQIFEGFSQTQIKSLMNILVQYVLKEDDENNENKFETFSRKFEQSPTPNTTLGWRPLEPEPSPIISTTFPPDRHLSSHRQPLHHRHPPPHRQPPPYKQPPLPPPLHPYHVAAKKSETPATPPSTPTPDSHISKTCPDHKDRSEEEEENNSSFQSQQSKEERLLVERKIHLTVAEIIHSSMEQFSDLLASQAVSEEETHICKDIRRRGKNKIAAQNCRKRKISQVSCLESQLSLARSRKENILSERVELLRRHQEWERKLGSLERNILVRLGKEENSWIINVDRNMVVKVEHKVFM